MHLCRSSENKHKQREDLTGCWCPPKKADGMMELNIQATSFEMRGYLWRSVHISQITVLPPTTGRLGGGRGGESPQTARWYWHLQGEEGKEGDRVGRTSAHSAAPSLGPRDGDQEGLDGRSSSVLVIGWERPGPKPASAWKPQWVPNVQHLEAVRKMLSSCEELLTP